MILLSSNQPADRFYRGGAKIDRFRRTTPGPDFRPEDWVASATTLAGENRLGLSVLPDGALLADALHHDPEWWLGNEHVRRFGNTSMLLVKLLDAGQRLPVHAHPHDEFSRRHVGRPFGKAEAWYILEGGDVHLGLVDAVSPEHLARLVEDQDTDALLDALHTRRVSPGDVVYVPPGELHAIGEGVFLVELQQPEDQSILLEWKGFDLDGELDGHLGLGFPLALTAVTTRARSDRDIDAWVTAGGSGESVLPADADPYFRLERHVVNAERPIERGFAVIVTVAGDLQARPAIGEAVALSAGTTAVTPYGAGPVLLEGSGTVLICRPPAATVDRTEVP